MSSPLASSGVYTYTVLSDGEPVTSGVYSIIVTKEVNRIPSASLVILDGSAASQSFEVSNKDLFIPGKRIEIRLGHQSNNDTVFQGVVISHSIKVREQISMLSIICKDVAFKMAVGRKSRYFRDQTDSDIIEDIIRQNSLESDVTATTRQNREVVQFDCTDWDFVLTRADSLGKICLTENGKLTIAAPNFSQTPALTVTYGKDLHEFDAVIDARTQFKAVKSVGWGMADQALHESEESTVDIREAGNLSASTLADIHTTNPLLQIHSGNLTEPELQEWTKSRLLKSRLAKIRGRAKFDGKAALQPGQLITLQGVGNRFEGSVFVSAVRHEFADGNWFTDAQFGLSPEWFAERYNTQAPPASGIIPAVTGLQIGVVTQLEDDPDGEHRVMVRLPVIDTNDEGSWARVATLDAGNNRGSFFRPEIDDEVIVGFLNNDPRHPVILGGVNSSAKPAPIDAQATNPQKGFVTRSGTRLVFDDEKKDIHIDTTDGNKITISGENHSIQIEDQNSNKITLEASGITLESKADISLKATGNVKIEGVQVEIKAQASGTFESTGNTVIKGGIVQIN